MFRKAPSTPSGQVPEQFRWMTVRMDLTAWGIITALTLVGLGVWSAGLRLADLSFTVENVVKSHERNGRIDEMQDQRIQSLEVALAKQQGYLEQILAAVRRDHNPTDYKYKP